MDYRILLGICVLPLAACSESPSEVAPSSAKHAALEAALAQDASEIEKAIATLRGVNFRQPVKISVSDQQGLLQYIDERRKLETTPERDRFLEESAKLLGLIGPELNLVQAIMGFYSAQVGGFYDPPSKSFRIMEGYQGDLARLIMAHEFVHALDDQHYNLDALADRMGNESDSSFAFSALCEGSAMLTMTQWMLANAAKLNPTALAEVQQKGMAGMQNLPPFVWKPSLAAYTAGQQFVQKGGAARLPEAFANPPRSSEQILHPEKYWDPVQRDDPARVEFVTSSVPAGWTVLGEDTLGEVGLALLTQPLAERKGLDPSDLGGLIGMRFTNEAASGWDGDRLILIEKAGVKVLEFAVLFDTAQDAQECVDRLKGLLAEGTPRLAKLQHTEQMVVLRVASQAEALDAFQLEARVQH